MSSVYWPPSSYQTLCPQLFEREIHYYSSVQLSFHAKLLADTAIIPLATQFSNSEIYTENYDFCLILLGRPATRKIQLLFQT